MNINEAINTENTIVQKRSIDSVDMDGEVVMMDIENGRYYGFNSVGSRIWKIIEQPATIAKVISTLLEEFDVDTKTCEKTVMEFLNKLYDEDLITVA